MNAKPVAREARLMALAALLSACGGDDGGPASPPPSQLAPPPAAGRTAAGCVSGTEMFSIISGDGQTASAPGVTLPERPAVRLSCASFDNGGSTMTVARATLRWSAGRGLADGSRSATSQTATDGTSSVSWTLAANYSDQSLHVSYTDDRNRSTGVDFSARVAGTTTTAQSCADPGGTDHGADLVLAADTAWSAAGSPHRGGRVALGNDVVFSIERGAVVCVEAIAAAAAGAVNSVIAQGEAQAPIRFFGTELRTGGELVYARGVNMPVVGIAGRPLGWIADSRFEWTVARDPATCYQVTVDANGSGIRRSVISGYGSANCAAIQLSPVDSSATAGKRIRARGLGVTDAAKPLWCCGGPYGLPISARVTASVGDALAIPNDTADVELFDCEIASSGRHGVVVAPRSAGLITAARCNFAGNAGDAIVNSSNVTVGASDNWWGDPAGPFGPKGDGVSGAVNVANPRAAPFTLGY
jgi:hypothetical protein